MISARAYGVLRYLQEHSDHISADALARVFPEGRRAMLTCLKELREAGLIVTQTTQIDGKWTKFSYLADVTDRSSVTALLLKGTLQNGNNSVSAHSYKTVRNPSAEPRKEEEMGYDFFDKTSSSDRDEALAERDKHIRLQKAAYAEQRAASGQKKLLNRRDIPKASWTVSDVAYEFSDRLQQHWHIKPWSVVQSRFVPALSNVRKQHDTNGEIEVEVMTRFFDSISINEYDDAEMLWKMFIKRFPAIVMQVKNMATGEVTEDSKIRTAKGLSKLED